MYGPDDKKKPSLAGEGSFHNLLTAKEVPQPAKLNKTVQQDGSQQDHAGSLGKHGIIGSIAASVNVYAVL